MYFMLVCAGAEQRQRKRESSKRPSRELRRERESSKRHSRELRRERERERERVLSGLAGN